MKKTIMIAVAAMLSSTAAFSAEATTEEAVTAPSVWNVERAGSVMDDSAKEIVIYNEAGEANRGTKLALLARCRDNSTDVIFVIAPGQFAMIPFWDYNSPKLRVKFDGEQAVANPSSPSTDSNGLFVGKPIDFIKKAVASKKVAVEIVTDQEQFITVFDLTGIEPLAAELADTCNWKL